MLPWILLVSIVLIQIEDPESKCLLKWIKLTSTLHRNKLKVHLTFKDSLWIKIKCWFCYRLVGPKFVGTLLLQHNYGTVSWLDSLAQSVKVFADVIIYFQTQAAKDSFHHLHLIFFQILEWTGFSRNDFCFVLTAGSTV